jgi:hypothetical protein
VTATQSEREVREGQVPPEAAPESLRGEARTCATSVTRADSVAFQVVTQSARALFRGGVSVLAAMDRAGSLADARPPSLRQDRDWHHRCAGHYQALILRWPRLAWGYVHLLIITPALRFTEWVTKSPARGAVAAAILAVIWFGR